MASPQIENGYTRIAHEILEQLYRTKLREHESRVLWFVIRKTYGWDKKTDVISISQIAKATNMNRGHAWRALTELKKRNMIISEGDQIGFQKDYEKWGGVPLREHPCSSRGTVPLREQKGVPLRELQKKEDLKESSALQKLELRRVVKGSLRKPQPTAPGFKETMALYHSLFATKFGVKPKIGAEEGKIVRDLLNSRGSEETQNLLRFFFDNPPEWVESKSKFTLRTFNGFYNELIAARAKQQAANQPLRGNNRADRLEY